MDIIDQLISTERERLVRENEEGEKGGGEGEDGKGSAENHGEKKKEKEAKGEGDEEMVEGEWQSVIAAPPSVEELVHNRKLWFKHAFNTSPSDCPRVTKVRWEDRACLYQKEISLDMKHLFGIAFLRRIFR